MQTSIQSSSKGKLPISIPKIQHAKYLPPVPSILLSISEPQRGGSFPRSRRCEERSDEAIQNAETFWIASSLRSSQRRLPSILDCAALLATMILTIQQQCHHIFMKMNSCHFSRCNAIDSFSINFSTCSY